MASSGFSVTVSVVDQASPTLAKASKQVDAYRQHWLGTQNALKDLDKTGREALRGIVNPRTTGAVADFAVAITGAGVKAGRAFQGIGQSVREAADQLARFAPAIGAIGAAGTIAGVAALARGFGNFGIQTVKTAAALDLDVKDVQAYGRAFEAAGLSAEEFVQSHANLNKTLLEARAGLNTRPIAAARYAQAMGWGSVDLSRTPEAVRKQVADVVKRMHLAGVNIETQAQFAEAFGISRDEISLLQRGGDAIQDLHDRAAATVVVSSELVERGKQLGESLIGLGQSAETAGYKIAGDLEPRLKPLIDGFASLLTNIDKIPGGMGTAEAAIGGLFALFTVEVLARMKSVSLALWGLRAGVVALAGLSVPGWLLALLGVGGAAAFIEGLREGAKPGDLGVTGQPGKVIDPESGLVVDTQQRRQRRRHGDPFGLSAPPRAQSRAQSQAQPQPGGLASRVWNALTGTWDWLTGPAATPAPTAPRQRPPGQYGALPGGGALSPAAYTAISQAEGTFRGGQIDYDTLLGYGKWGRPDKPITTMTLQEVSDFGMQMRRAQAAEGKPWGQTSSALGAFQITGSNVRDYAAAHRLDMATARFTPELQQQMAAEIARRQGSAAWEGFKTHPDLRQAFDRARAPNAVAGSAPPVQIAAVPGAGQQMADTGGSDTSHEVTVHFVDAPAGLRSGVTRADGPARLALRTNYAMAAPF